MKATLLTALLPAAGIAAAGVALPEHLRPHHHARGAHARASERLSREALDARSFAESRNAERGVGNYTMAEWQEMYGAADEGEIHQLVKRGSYHGRATFYSPAANACGGGPEGNDDNIVALNVGMYGDNGNDVSPYCFKQIMIQYGSKTEQAEIVDACMGCPANALDMSPGLFAKFADPSVGIFYMTWWFAGEGDGGSSGSGSDGGGDSSPKTTSSPKPTPTSTYVAPTTTPSSSKASSSSSSAASSSSASVSVSNSTASSAPAGGMTQQGGLLGTANWALEGGNLDRTNQVVMALGNLVAQVAAQASASA